MHIPEAEKCNWLREKIETIDPVRKLHEKLPGVDGVTHWQSKTPLGLNL